MLLSSQASLGDAVRGARKRAGLSQEAVALQAGMARQSLVALERGRANPTWDTLLRVAWVVGLVLAATPGELPDPADATPLPRRRVPSTTPTTPTTPTSRPRPQRPQPPEPTPRQVPAGLLAEPPPVDLKALLKAYWERPTMRTDRHAPERFTPEGGGFAGEAVGLPTAHGGKPTTPHAKVTDSGAAPATESALPGPPG